MKRVLITGANRGIGLELVRQSLEANDLVFAGCRFPKRARDLHLLEDSYPHLLRVLTMDVDQESTLDKARDDVEEVVEGLDVLINNAGIYIGKETILDVGAEDLMAAVRVNAVGPILVAQRFLELLRNGKSAKIVNISSEAGSISKMEGFRGYSYFGSKAILNMYTRALAFDKNTDGIIVIALHPGWVRTDMGGSIAPLSVQESAQGILSLIERLTPAHHGKFLTHDGVDHPW